MCFGSRTSGNAIGAAGCGTGWLGGTWMPIMPRLLDAAMHLLHRLVDVGQRDVSDREQATSPRTAVVGDVVVVGPHAGDGQLGIEECLEAERHRAVQHLRIDTFAVHVLDADAVEDTTDGGFRMDGGEGALAGPFGLREDTFQLAARTGIAVTDHEPRLALAIGQRREPVAKAGVEVVEEDHRVLHLVRVGVDDHQAVVHGGGL